MPTLAHLTQTSDVFSLPDGVYTIRANVLGACLDHVTLDHKGNVINGQRGAPLPLVSRYVTSYVRRRRGGNFRIWLRSTPRVPITVEIVPYEAPPPVDLTKGTFIRGATVANLSIPFSATQREVDVLVGGNWNGGRLALHQRAKDTTWPETIDVWFSANGVRRLRVPSGREWRVVAEGAVSVFLLCRSVKD